MLERYGRPLEPTPTSSHRCARAGLALAALSCASLPSGLLRTRAGRRLRHPVLRSLTRWIPFEPSRHRHRGGAGGLDRFGAVPFRRESLLDRFEGGDNGPVSCSPCKPLAREDSANASWIIFLGLVVANSMLRRLSPGLADLFVLAGALTALGAGVAGLFYAGREERRGIVLPALIGIGLNGLLLLIFVANNVILAKQRRVQALCRVRRNDIDRRTPSSAR